MAVRAWRQARIPASSFPSNETPPRSPRTAWRRRAESSRRRAPSVPFAHVAKNLSPAGTASRRRGDAARSPEHAVPDRALLLALRRVHERVRAGHHLVHRAGRGDEGRGADRDPDAPAPPRHRGEERGAEPGQQRPALDGVRLGPDEPELVTAEP